VKKSHPSEWIGHSCKQRAKHHGRCRRAHHRSNTHRQAKYSVCDPADPKRFHGYFCSGVCRVRYWLRRERRPSPEVPISWETPPFPSNSSENGLYPSPR
jgi:hypothetical protein